jgi:hypothetical protein
MEAWFGNLVSKREEILAMDGGVAVWNSMTNYLAIGAFAFGALERGLFETRRVVLERSN